MFQQEKELTLSFDRLELIEKIKAAREKHMVELEMNRLKLMDKSIKMLEKALAIAKSKKNGGGKANKKDEQWAARVFGEISALNSGTQSHEKEYDEIIDMLGAAKNATVQLGASAYRQFVQGQWQMGFGQWANPYPLGVNSPISGTDTALGEYIQAPKAEEVA